MTTGRPSLHSEVVRFQSAWSSTRGSSLFLRSRWRTLSAASSSHSKPPRSSSSTSGRGGSARTLITTCRPLSSSAATTPARCPASRSLRTGTPESSTAPQGRWHQGGDQNRLPPSSRRLHTQFEGSAVGDDHFQDVLVEPGGSSDQSHRRSSADRWWVRGWPTAAILSE